MAGKLLKYSTDELLKKFGAGNHKPGSGSAAALQGLLSAQLIRTVINLSTDDKRKKRYEEWLDEFKKIDAQIESEIYPELERIFQEDSEQFDKAINQRIQRDNERNPIVKRHLDDQAQEELKPATQMPIDIANFCIRLARAASLVFRNGFRAVRGDSGVALNNAVSAIAGCLSIIDLNLLSIHSDRDTDRMRLEADMIRTEYQDLLDEAHNCLAELHKESQQMDSYYKEINELFALKGSRLSYEDIENLVRKLQNTLWKHRYIIWKKNTPKSELEILNPERVFPVIGYCYERETSLGIYETPTGAFEIAGIIDNKNKHVMISEKFDPTYRNFTAAHELGHALLHKHDILHRDRPLDGTHNTRGRERQELQADKFSAYFLMPGTLVRRMFREKFFMDKFVINDDTVFALNERSASEFRKRCEDLRGLSLFIANVEFFAGYTRKSLADVFNVSQGAMAIRLEELGLVEF